MTLTPDARLRILRALIKGRCNIRLAAAELDLDPQELRRRMLADHELINTAVEELLRKAEEAEAVLRRGMREGPLENRIQAAAFIAKRRLEP